MRAITIHCEDENLEKRQNDLIFNNNVKIFQVGKTGYAYTLYWYKED